MSNIKNIVVFNTTKFDGQMNSAKPFYPGLEDKPQKRLEIATGNKQMVADKYNFDRTKIFMALQANQNHPYEPGHIYQLTEEDIIKYADLYDYDVWADTVKLTKNTPNAVIGFNVSDAPNVIAINRRTGDVTSTFCSGAHINKGVPLTIANAVGGNLDEIMIDVSPFAYTLPFIQGKDMQQPNWISNDTVWQDCITEKNGILLIDMKKALLDQLIAAGINPENIYVREDSLWNKDKYYSSQRARITNNPREDGRIMHVAFYLPEGQEIKDPNARVYKLVR